MPRQDGYGIQPPLELLRQVVDGHFLHHRQAEDRSEEKITLADDFYIGAMGSHGPAPIHPRLQRHFVALGCQRPGDDVSR